MGVTCLAQGCTQGSALAGSGSWLVHCPGHHRLWVGSPVRARPRLQGVGPQGGCVWEAAGGRLSLTDVSPSLFLNQTPVGET